MSAKDVCENLNTHSLKRVQNYNFFTFQPNISNHFFYFVYVFITLLPSFLPFCYLCHSILLYKILARLLHDNTYK